VSLHERACDTTAADYRVLDYCESGRRPTIRDIAACGHVTGAPTRRPVAGLDRPGAMSNCTTRINDGHVCAGIEALTECASGTPRPRVDHSTAGSPPPRRPRRTAGPREGLPSAGATRRPHGEDAVPNRWQQRRIFALSSDSQCSTSRPNADRRSNFRVARREVDRSVPAEGHRLRYALTKLQITRCRLLHPGQPVLQGPPLTVSSLLYGSQ